MSKKIDSKIELQVITNWLKGMNREENSSSCGIATGSVSNILDKWLASLFGYDIETIREFALQVRKANFTVKDCALGYRIYSILENLGISDSDTQILFF